MNTVRLLFAFRKKCRPIYFLFVKKWSSHIQNDYSFQRIQTTNTVMEFHYKKNENPDITIIMMMIIFLMIMGKKEEKKISHLDRYSFLFTLFFSLVLVIGCSIDFFWKKREENFFYFSIICIISLDQIIVFDYNRMKWIKNWIKFKYNNHE